jgi:hypothetical protein
VAPTGSYGGGGVAGFMVEQDKEHDEERTVHLLVRSTWRLYHNEEGGDFGWCSCLLKMNQL